MGSPPLSTHVDANRITFTNRDRTNRMTAMVHNMVFGIARILGGIVHRERNVHWS